MGVRTIVTRVTSDPDLTKSPCLYQFLDFMEVFEQLSQGIGGDSGDNCSKTPTNSRIQSKLGVLVKPGSVVTLVTIAQRLP